MIEYKFPSDHKMPQLRGVTAQGGIPSTIVVDRKPIKGIMFETEIGGQRLFVKVEGRPEIQALVEEYEAAKRAAADALKQKQAAEAAAKSLAAEQQKARDALAAQQAAAAQREIDKYMDGIRTRVRREVLVPPSLQGNPEAEATVTLLPGGEVLDVRISKSSGNAAYDSAIESAIRKAQPFSVPVGVLFQQNFRRFTMIFRPVQ